VFARQHVELRAIAQCHRQLLVFAERRQDVERLHRVMPGLFVVTEEPRQPRQPADVAPDCPRHVQFPPQAQRLDSRIARRGELAGQITLVRLQIQQLRARGRLDPSGPGKRAAIVRGGLAMCAQGGRLLRRRLREPEHRFGISGSDGVMREPREDAGTSGRRRQCGEHNSMELLHAQHRQRLQYRQPRQLVTESDRAAVECQEARLQRWRERLVECRYCCAQEINLGSRRYDRHEVHDVPGLDGDVGALRQDRLAHSRRHSFASGAEDFRHEERVALRQAEDGLRVTRVAR
jgi:hypothetical protein